MAITKQQLEHLIQETTTGPPQISAGFNQAPEM
jgi:hypothetical protein